MSNESSDFEYNLIFPIISSKYYNEDNFNSTNKNTNPVGTGKYYISDVENEEIILKKNTNWWKDEQLKLDTIKIKKYDNVKKEIDAIKMNDIDIMASSLNNIDEYLKDSKCNQIKYIGRNYDYIAINCNNKILKDIIKDNIHVRCLVYELMNNKMSMILTLMKNMLFNDLTKRLSDFLIKIYYNIFIYINLSQ